MSTDGRTPRRHGVGVRTAVGVAVVCLSITGLAPPTMAAPEFELRGTVVDQHGAPLGSICVDAEEGSMRTGSAITDVDGTYVVPIDRGTHHLRFTDCATTPTHVTQWWSGHPARDGADAVTVVDADVTLAAISLRTGVAVSGTVHDRGGAGQPDTSVQVSSTDGTVSAGAVTGPDGTYRTAPLPDGAYTVRFEGPADSGQPTQYWKSAWTRASAHELPLSAATGTELRSVDAWMVDGATVAGTVTDLGGDPLGNICVSTYERVGDAPGDRVGSATTAPDGTYRITNLPPVDALVQFGDCSGAGYLGEWHRETSSPRESEVVHLEAGSSHVGLDAQLARGGTITGTVTDDAGAALGRICVSAVRDGDGDGDDEGGETSVVGAETGADGSYRLSGIDDHPVLVRFHDCNGVGPYIEEWFDSTGDASTATTLTVTDGGTRSGVDARLARAGTVSGRVTDRSGPLGDVCVQASDDRGVASSGRTEGDGGYRLEFERSGSFRLQFVDCSDHPDHVGTWWGGGTAASSATPVRVEVGEDVDDISVELADGAAGAVRGRVTNVRGEPMTDICVVVYLAHGTVRVAATSADGSYTVPDIGSGTWAVAYLACGEKDIELQVVDPAVPTIAYPAQWLGGATLDVPAHEDGPDPIAQGARLVEVPAGSSSDADFCFGCGMVAAEVASRADDTVTFSFDAPGLLDGPGAGRSVGTEHVASRATTAPLTYQVTCSAPGAPALHSAVVDSAGSAVGVVGLVAGATYDCEVAASVDGVTVATSSALSVAAPPTPTPASASDPTDATDATATPSRAGAPPSRLAFTGSDLLPMLVISLVLVVAGLVLIAGGTLHLTRIVRSSRRARDHIPTQPTSAPDASSRSMRNA